MTSKHCGLLPGRQYRFEVGESVGEMVLDRIRELLD